MTVGTFVCGIVANSISGILIDFFDKKSEMTLPILCAIKALIDVPFCIMTYMQQSNFYLSMAGIYCQLLFAKGWTAPAILMIKTVSDPSVESIAVAMFLLFQNLVYSISAKLMGNISRGLDIDPVKYPRQYGYLATANTAIPDFLAFPFFMIAGFYMRAIKRQKLVSGEIDKVKLEENR